MMTINAPMTCVKEDNAITIIILYLVMMDFGAMERILVLVDHAAFMQVQFSHLFSDTEKEIHVQVDLFVEINVMKILIIAQVLWELLAQVIIFTATE